MSQNDFDQGNVRRLKRLRKKPIPKNRVEAKVDLADLEMALEQSAYVQVRVSDELKKRGLFVSPRECSRRLAEA